MNDFRFALRQLLKSPAFTLVAILTLALGIGANSAIFSVIDAVLLRALPFPHADRLTMIWETAPQRPGDDRQVHSYPDYLDLRAQNHTFAAMAAYSDASTIWGTGEEAVDVPGIAVTADIFQVLGTAPLLGRGFSREDEKRDAARVVVISYGFWQRHFAADPNILGRKVTIAGHPATITGVMPSGWKFPVQDDQVNYLAPVEQLYGTASSDPLSGRGSHFLSMVGCLKAGVALRTATADLQTIAAQLARQYPDTNAGRTVRLVALQADVVGSIRPALLVLTAAVALVLLIACANVANLFLARAAAREREIAIRSALGASRFQIVRQLLCETLILALLGAGAGLLLAWWTTDALVALAPADLPRLSDIRVNGTVISFTLGVALLTSLIFGLVPAWQVSRPQVEQALKEASRGSTGGTRSHRLRAAFVVSQFALSLVLLVGAGLLIRSFAELRAVQPGFDARGVATFWQALPKSRYDSPTKQAQFFEKLLTKLRALPGVTAAGMGSPLPFSDSDRSTSFGFVGQPPPAPGMQPSASNLTTDGSYFSTMRIALRRGRVFDERDRPEAPPVLLINEAFAKQYFPGQDPLGQRIAIGPTKEKRAVVGIVANSKHSSLAEPNQPEFYLPFSQNPDGFMDLVVRTGEPVPNELETTLRRAVHEVDAQQFVPVVRPLTQLLSQTLTQSRFNTALLGAFATVAILLAAIGIYGVIAYNVAQRTKEIGIRMALGAQRRQMLLMILRQSLTMAAIGIVIGVASAFAATRLLSALLFGVGPTDLLTYAAVIVVLASAAFLAALIPARRAMKINPVIALHYE
ncbi:MAG: ABC transporter permease [Chthoniobacterales bacterium]|nr:ABC transporter permease [Chthoniobacterales bacterium]